MRVEEKGKKQSKKKDHGTVDETSLE